MQCALRLLLLLHPDTEAMFACLVAAGLPLVSEACSHLHRV